MKFGAINPYYISKYIQFAENYIDEFASLEILELMSDPPIPRLHVPVRWGAITITTTSTAWFSVGTPLIELRGSLQSGLQAY